MEQFEKHDAMPGTDHEILAKKDLGEVSKSMAYEAAAERPRGYLSDKDRERYMPIKFQDGPIGEVGVNGVQVDDVLFKCLTKLQGFNGNFPCTENTYAIQHLQETLFWLRARRENRETRGVEGFNKL